jgi:putative nucleotidyltransferase with HDIG domain
VTEMESRCRVVDHSLRGAVVRWSHVTMAWQQSTESGARAFTTPSLAVWQTWVGLAVVVFSTGLLNRTAEQFQASEGVALIFPASAVTVLAGLLLGWWGVLATFVGYALTPWGLSTTLPRNLFFAFAVTLQAAIPVLVLRLDATSSTVIRTIRLLTWAVLANVAVSALVAVPGIIMFGAHGRHPQTALIGFVGWFFSDMTAVLMLAIPLLVLVRPEWVMEPEAERFFRRWRRDLREIVPVIAVLVAVAIIMRFTIGLGPVTVHWIALGFLVPVIWAAARGGIGASLAVNGVAGFFYVAAVVRTARAEGGMVNAELFSSYMNLVAFGVAAVAAGLAWSQSHQLVAKLDEHRRLLQESFETVVTALAAAVEAKDPTTEGHVQRVARTTVAVGRKLGLSGSRLELLRYAALLHDVGKIGVPEHVLNKPGDLNEDERDLMERHVTVGVDILQSVEILRPAVPFIRYHQERWDGRTDDGVRYPGYFGLSGEEIPLEARIIAVVDAWDAMTNDRPYRRALGRERAVEELTREAGHHFDPSVVAALLQVVRQGLQDGSSERLPVLGDAAPEWIS